MSVHQFSLATVHLIDGGRIEEAWAQALRRVIADLQDRPGCYDARKVTLQAEFKPNEHDGGETADVTFQIKDTVPTRKSKSINMQARRVAGFGPALVFNDLSEDDIHQRTIDEDGVE